MSDAGGRIPVRTAKQIANNFFGHRPGINKDGGTVPLRLLENRFEKTMYDEDPDVLNNYLRKSAKFNGPDPILWEQDAPRRSAATNAGLLNLRLGASLGTKADQNHSEMFLGFLPSDKYFGHDPRGTNEDPDFREASIHMNHRAKQYVKGMPIDRAEDIVIDTGNIYRPIKDKRDTFYPTKDRLRIFSTTLDSMPNTKQKEVTAQTHKFNMNNAAIALPINELEDAYRSPDYTTVTSNQYLDPYPMSVSDHRIPVARYGDTRLTPHLSNYNLHGDRIREQQLDQKHRDEMGNYKPISRDTIDPRLISGIYSRLSEYDQKTKDSNENTTISKNEVLNDIKRFVSDLTTPKTNQNNEIGLGGIYNTISYEGNSINDMLINTTTDNKINKSIKDLRDEYAGDGTKIKVDNASLYLMQNMEKRKGNMIDGESFIQPYKNAQINVLSNSNGAVFASQYNQTDQQRKYQGISNELETVSYRDLQPVGNIHDMEKVMDQGDIDFYDSLSVRKRNGNTDPVNMKSHDKNIVMYDKVERKDHIGDDGKYISNKAINSSSRQKHMSVTNLESNKTFFESDSMNRSINLKKNNKTKNSSVSDGLRTRKENINRFYES
jgi:hypothetical protein